MIVWGNHLPTMYPDIRFATVAGKAAPALVNDEASQERIHPKVGKRGAAIIEARGPVVRRLGRQRAIDHARLEHGPTAVGDHGRHLRRLSGIPEGMIYGMPHLRRRRREVVRGLDIDAFSREMDFTLGELTEGDGVKHLLPLERGAMALHRFQCSTQAAGCFPALAAQEHYAGKEDHREGLELQARLGPALTSPAIARTGTGHGEFDHANMIATLV